MSAIARPNTVITLNRLRLAVMRNNSTARRNGDSSVDPLVAAAIAQARSLREARPSPQPD